MNGSPKREGIVAAIRQAGLDNALSLAQLAVEDTGMGVVDHKRQKNEGAASMSPGMEDLISDGKVTRGWLGVQIDNVNEGLAKALKLDNLNGAIITQVIKDSPAEDAGVKEKDVIVSGNPKDIKLPQENVSSKFVFAKENDFFAYPNNYNYYANYYKNTFQHGGVSLEEMIIPFVEMRGK